MDVCAQETPELQTFISMVIDKLYPLTGKSKRGGMTNPSQSPKPYALSPKP